MTKRLSVPEELPTEPILDQLVTAFDDISATEHGPSEFSILSDGNRFETVRPVFYEPFYYDEEELAPVSQRIIYSSTVRKKPAAQRQLIDMIDQAWDAIDELNSVKFFAQSTQLLDDTPDSIEHVHQFVRDQERNPSKTIGGLLMVKCTQTDQVGLRCVYNKAIMGITAVVDAQRGIESSDERRIRDISALVACYGLANSIKRKPAIVTFPNTIGFQGL